MIMLLNPLGITFFGEFFESQMPWLKIRPILLKLNYHVICASAAYQIQAKNVMFIKYVCPFFI